MNQYSDHEIRMMKIACIVTGVMLGIYFGRYLFSKQDIVFVVAPETKEPHLKVVPSDNEPV